MTQAARLLDALSGGEWCSNFALYRRVYAAAPCGRLGAVVWKLNRFGHVIEGMRDTRYQAEFGIGPVNNARYWYRLVAAKPEVHDPKAADGGRRKRLTGKLADWAATGSKTGWIFA